MPSRNLRESCLPLLLWLSLGFAPGPATGTDADETVVAPEDFPVVAPGLVVELVAAEPLVVDPVAFDWGPDGRLWVVEMRDYPLGKGGANGRVTLLEDTDGNGRFDRSTVFLDGLRFPSGIMTWGRGALVTCAPEIFYAEDLDGDGYAERREVLFTGFGEVNPQHRVNGLRWGLDNWIYCASGDFAPTRRRPGDPGFVARSFRGPSPGATADVRGLTLSGSAVRSLKTGLEIDIRNRDFRFRPTTGELDPQSGQSQYGRDRDDWGNWFACNHATPIWHYALHDHYLRRNPHVVPPSPRVVLERPVTFAIGSRGRGTGSRRRAEGNPFTSACSVTVYRDELLGSEYAGNWFVCEPVHNLVHRGRLTPSGVTFSSRRATDESDREFLASSDVLFSPAMIRAGPDGALWIADMQRLVLEHPHWLPPGWEATVNVRQGDRKGRIYRVFPATRRPRALPRLDELSTTNLVSHLDSPSGWVRDKVQQLLVERGDPTAVNDLERLAVSSVRPAARLQALCTLKGLNALRADLIERSLTDEHEGVRRHAVRLAESLLDDETNLGRAVLRRIDDPQLTVRQQVAYSLGAWRSTDAATALGRLLWEYREEELIAAAALSSLTVHNIEVVVAFVLSRATDVTRSTDLLENLLASAIGLGASTATSQLLAAVLERGDSAPAAEQWNLLAKLLRVVHDAELQPEEALGPDHATTARALAATLAAARRAAGSDDAPTRARVAAVGLLGQTLRLDFAQASPDRELLGSLLSPGSPVDLQAAAVSALAGEGTAEGGQRLLARWHEHSPRMREHILRQILRQPSSVVALLEAFEQGAIDPQEVDSRTSQLLREYPESATRARALRIFQKQQTAETRSAKREDVVRSYRGALSLEGDTNRGAAIFRKRCAACHDHGTADARGSSESGRAGPDLTTVRDKTPDYLLTAILDPNRAAEAKFFGYSVVLRDGGVLFGMIAEETAATVTLVTSTGERHVVLRSRLASLTSSQASIMPEGLEKDLTVQAMADLIALLRSSTFAHDIRQGSNGQ